MNSLNIKIPVRNNYELNHKNFSGMKVPLRPFVQILVFNNADDKNAIDVFSIPYNYFEDFVLHFGEPGIGGTLTVLNPYPISNEKREKDRFQKFQDIIASLVKIDKKNPTDKKDENARARAYYRFGWCDEEAVYYVSKFSRFGIINLKVNFSVEGFRTKIDFMDFGQKISHTQRIDVTLENNSTDILLDVAVYLMLNYDIKMDFLERDDQEYRIWKNTIDTEASREFIKSMRESVKNNSDAQQQIMQLIKRDFTMQSPARAALKGNSSNSVGKKYSAQQQTVFEYISQLTKSIIKPDDNLYNESKAIQRERIYVSYESPITSDDNDFEKNPIFLTAAKKEMFDVIDIPNNNFKEVNTTINLSWKPAVPNDKTIVAERFANYTGGNEKLSEKYKKYLLPSRDGGIYTYFPSNVLPVDYKDKIFSTKKVRQSNVLNFSIDSEAWMGFYLQGTQYSINIDRSTGETTSLMSKSQQKYVDKPTSVVSNTIQDPTNNLNGSSKAQAAFIQSYKNILVNKGTVEILGDPTLCFGGNLMGKYIYLTVCYPNGDIIKEFTGFYNVWGYTHSVASGRFTTQLYVLMPPTCPFALFDGKTKEEVEQKSQIGSDGVIPIGANQINPSTEAVA
jgi:hypothetical protein